MTIKNLLVTFGAGLLLSASVSVQAQDKLRIYAASSMTNAVNELVSEFEKQSSISATPVYAGTSSLARQIHQGAPADVFIAANEKWVNYLIEQKVINGDAVTNVAQNQLVVITPVNHQGSLDINDSASWLNYLQKGRIAIGQTNAVPAGIYAKESLESLGIWSAVERSLAPTNNVRIALALVERNEVPLGIVYKTDALMSEGVKIIARLPESSHSPIVYPMAQLNAKPQVEAFAQFMKTQQARNVLQRYGFEVEHQ